MSSFNITAGAGVRNVTNSDTITFIDGVGIDYAVSAALEVTASLNLNELTTTSTSGNADFFAVINSGGSQFKIAPGNINNSTFNNNAGYITSGSLPSVSNAIITIATGTGLSGAGTFTLNGGYEDGMKVVERCELFSLLANVGDTRSLILHPASTTHRQLTPEARSIAGAGDDVIRLSIGIESVDDLIADLDYALGE